MSEQFTKGEWHTEQRTKGVIILALNEHLNAGFSICAVNGPESGANAALIACAPEMYEMLKDLLGNSSFNVEHSGVADKIELILAKARGEA